MNIKVNGIPYEYEGDRISYAALVRLGWQAEPRPEMRVTARWPVSAKWPEGFECRLVQGHGVEPLPLESGMSFTVEPRA